jgi:hypothetical protein
MLCFAPPLLVVWYSDIPMGFTPWALVLHLGPLHISTAVFYLTSTTSTSTSIQKIPSGGVQSSALCARFDVVVMIMIVIDQQLLLRNC